MTEWVFLKIYDPAPINSCKDDDAVYNGLTECVWQCTWMTLNGFSLLKKNILICSTLACSCRPLPCFHVFCVCHWCRHNASHSTNSIFSPWMVTAVPTSFQHWVAGGSWVGIHHPIKSSIRLLYFPGLPSLKYSHNNQSTWHELTEAWKMSPQGKMLQVFIILWGSLVLTM